MIEQRTPYGIGVEIPGEYQETVDRVKEELAREGFGVLCEIDIAATLKKKLGKDVGPYVILGACNPPLAYQALSAEPDIGLLLPCNIVIRVSDAPGMMVVAAMDPVAALDLARNDAIRPIATDVKSRLIRVVEAVERQSRT